MIKRLWKRLVGDGFLSGADEWHAFVNGFCSGFCLFIPLLRSGYLPVREVHYFHFGLALGWPFGVMTGYGLAQLAISIF